VSGMDALDLAAIPCTGSLHDDAVDVEVISRLGDLLQQEPWWQSVGRPFVVRPTPRYGAPGPYVETSWMRAAIYLPSDGCRPVDLAHGAAVVLCSGATEPAGPELLRAADLDVIEVCFGIAARYEVADALRALGAVVQAGPWQAPNRRGIAGRGIYGNVVEHHLVRHVGRLAAS
jgi:hypothetical protein